MVGSSRILIHPKPSFAAFADGKHQGFGAIR